MQNLNDKEYWDKVWSKFRKKEDSKEILAIMADRANTKEYWDAQWTGKRRRHEKYSMQYAWWKVAEYKPKSVLDAACGNGRLLYGIKVKNPEIELFGMDISEVGINRMRNEYGINGVIMDVYDIDKVGKSFDFIIGNHLLEHLYRDAEFLFKARLVLNDGGYMFVAVPNDMSGPEETEEHVRKYNEESLKKVMMGVFRNVETKIIGNHLIAISKK